MMPGSRSLRAALRGVCALVVLVYLPALGGPFQFDDYVTVATDPGARSFAAWWDNVGTHVRPLLKASFALTAFLGRLLGDMPAGHRIGNLAIHLGATVAFYRLGSRWAATLEPWREAGRRDAHALLAAAVFALHPLATEAVNYVSARSASLATLASVLALAAWLRAREAEGGRRIAWVAAGIASWVVACGSREVAVLTPAMVLLVEWLRAPHADPRARTRTLAGLACATVLGIVVFAAWMASHARYGPLLELSGRILEARIGEPAMATALAYLGCVAALACAPDIDPAPVPASWPQAFALLAALALSVALAVRARRRHPMALVALAWAALWLLPVYALPIRHDPVAERHAYPAVWSLGWLAGAAALPFVGSPARRVRVAGRALAAIVLAVLVTLSAARSREYRSEESLWEAAARDSPARLRVLNNLGAAYIERGRWEDAERVLRAARALDPGNEIVEINLERALRRSSD